jgi:hypothetical protein
MTRAGGKGAFDSAQAPDLLSVNPKTGTKSALVFRNA